MSIEYSGTIVTNEAYKVKKMQSQINALLVAYTSLEEENMRLKDRLAARPATVGRPPKVIDPNQPVVKRSHARKKPVTPAK